MVARGELFRALLHRRHFYSNLHPFGRPDARRRLRCFFPSEKFLILSLIIPANCSDERRQITDRLALFPEKSKLDLENREWRLLRQWGILLSRNLG